jgi:hypothetical protein
MNFSLPSFMQLTIISVMVYHTIATGNVAPNRREAGEKSYHQGYRQSGRKYRMQPPPARCQASPEISEDTRERVVKICKEMGYTPISVARSMVMKQTKLLWAHRNQR